MHLVFTQFIEKISDWRVTFTLFLSLFRLKFLVAQLFLDCLILLLVYDFMHFRILWLYDASKWMRILLSIYMQWMSMEHNWMGLHLCNRLCFNRWPDRRLRFLILYLLIRHHKLLGCEGFLYYWLPGLILYLDLFLFFFVRMLQVLSMRLVYILSVLLISSFLWSVSWIFTSCDLHCFVENSLSRFLINVLQLR